jgi:hypothetical protein
MFCRFGMTIDHSLGKGFYACLRLSNSVCRLNKGMAENNFG